LQQAGYVVNVTEVVAVEVDDRPGGLAGLLETLEPSGVNIEYMYAFASGGKSGRSWSSGFDRADVANRNICARPASTCCRTSGCERLADDRGADGTCFVDPPHVRDRHPASQGARGGERLRLHAGQPRRRDSRGRDRALRRVVAENRPRSHGYMPNAGFPEVRAAIAKRLAERSGVPLPAKTSS